jgi:hypothetical protein
MLVYILILDLKPVSKTHTHKTMIVNARPSTSAEERKLDRRFAYANPTLVQRRQADADLQPTITTFYHDCLYLNSRFKTRI